MSDQHGTSERGVEARIAGAPLSGIAVVVIDDHGALRRGVRDVLVSSGAEILAETADAAGGLSAVTEHRPDVVLLDLKLPDRPGIELLPALLDGAPGVRVLVFTVSTEPADVALALSLGASGFVGKDVAPRRLVAAVTAAAGGDVVVSAAFAGVVRELAHRGSRPTPDGAPLSLTTRQEDVLALLAQGMSNREVARALSVSTGTVKQYVADVLEVLGVENRVQAAVWAAKAGIG